MDAKAAADAYGVAVRAGVITPQAEDEEEFRKRLALPPMSPDAKAAWRNDKGTRRPITLTQPGTQASPTQGTTNENEDEPQDAPGDTAGE
jgi:hypothetical protein